MSVAMLDAPEATSGEGAFCGAIGDVLSRRVGVEAHGGGSGGEGPHEALENVRHAVWCL
jgi:hypothetical protein